MRKGYLLTALAAAVLLAASSGTAWAQVTGVVSHGEGGVLITMPSKVSEGETATISVSVMGTVARRYGWTRDDCHGNVHGRTGAGPSRQSAGSATAAEDNQFQRYPKQ